MRRETTSSRITVAVRVPMAGAGGFARRNGVPCDLWQFYLGDAAVVVSSLIGTIVCIRIYVARGLIRGSGFPLYVAFNRS